MKQLACVCLAIAMMLGTVAVVPFSAKAYHYEDKVNGAAPSGVEIPEGIPIYDGVQTETPANGAVALERDATDGAFLIQSAAEFMYFRNVLATQETLYIGEPDAAEETLTALPATDAIFKLTCDIALNGANYGGGEWTVTNGFGAVTGTFSGTFDGGNHTIYNLYEYNAAGKTVALFHTVTGTVKNLNFAGARIAHSSVGLYDGTYSALVAVQLDGTVDNVHGTACSLMATYAGGIAAKMLNGAKIQNCSMDGSVTGSVVAGIVGTHLDANETTENAYITIDGCVNNADVTCTTAITSPNQMSVAAGILGSEQNWNNPTTGFCITNCENNGNITALNVAAGIVGVSHKASQVATLTNCVNRGNITTTDAGGVSGGIAGDVPGSGGEALHTTAVLTRCYNYGDVTAVGTAGGVVGKTNPDDKSNPDKGEFFKDCGNYGKVTSDGVAGGILGQTSGLSYVGNVNLYFSNCISAGDVKGGTVAGGLIGQADIRGTTIAVAGCLITCNVTGVTQAAALLGNAANQETNGTVALTRSWVTGTIAVAEGGTAALFVISANTVPTKLTATDSGFAVTVKVGETLLTAEETVGAYYLNSESAFVPVESYKDGSTTVNARYPVTDIASFTDGTAKTSLNTYATNNGYTIWAQAKNAPAPVTTLGITGATMTLGGNMKLNLMLRADTLAGLDVAKVTFADADNINDTGIDATLLDNGYYSVSYDKLAREMATDSCTRLVITLQDGTVYTGTNILTVSPAEYLIKLYGNYSGEQGTEAASVISVVENMLAYGAEAEAKANGTALTGTAVYKLAEAAGIVLPTEFTYTNEHRGEMTQADVDKLNAITETGASLTGNISFYFKLTNTAYTALTVNGTDVYTVNGDGTIVWEEIRPGTVKNTYTLVFSGDGVDDVTANFCVGDFLEARRQANVDNDQALAAATIRYMMAVKAYADNL